MQLRYLLSGFCLAVLVTGTANAQIDSSLLVSTPKDTVPKNMMNMDAINNRPFLTLGKAPVSLGGYIETNWQHLGTDGASDGHQFQFRRVSFFMASSITKHILFNSEIEYEPSENSIEVEYAAVDVNFNPLLNLRGGMIVNPIGAFNQNHDGPKWEFTDRPIAMEQLLPDTWSNAGFGIYGKKYAKDWMFGYEFYVTGGFDGSIIDNSFNRTYLPAAKDNVERFEETNSGKPLYTAKIAIRNNHVGEFGFSYMGGQYNQTTDDGTVFDSPRNVNIWDVDFNTEIKPTQTNIRGEMAWVHVDIPANYYQQFGSKQFGGYVDVVQPILKTKILDWKNSVVNLACRLEYADWNVGRFHSTDDAVFANQKIGDDAWSIVPAISFRPVPQTVFRLNYRIMKQYDIYGNKLSSSNGGVTTGGFSIGLATYF